MRELTADFLVSMDGFASDADGTQNWIRDFFGPDMTQFIQDVLSQPQELVLGRKTYEVLFGYWPNAEGPQARPMNDLSKVVFSRTLIEPLGWSNARLAKGRLEDAVRALKRESGSPLRSIGSIELVKHLLDAQLVDRLRLMVFPTSLGTSGRQPIFEGHQARRFRLAESKVLDSNVLVLDYRPPEL
ncbi:MAG: dihydrofolate reductase family protein [Actinobacteria bacterium]|nr:dihydrofolate reductase family protein [Actinomycetota bacterium]